MADVESERRGAIQILRINRPEARNALNSAAIRGIASGIQDAEADPEVLAVIVTGSGDRAFCSGMDLRGFSQGHSGDQAPDDRSGISAYQRFIREGSVKPVIAAANGTAVAGGFELLLACDMAVAASTAQFGLPEVKRSLFPAGGGVFLSRRIPAAIAAEILLTGETFGAERALALGLVNRVVPSEEVLDVAVSLAERVTANGPLAVQAILRLARVASRHLPADVWALQEQLRPAVFGSDDAREGATAFIERRPPVWQGR